MISNCTIRGAGVERRLNVAVWNVTVDRNVELVSGVYFAKSNRTVGESSIAKLTILKSLGI